MCPVDREPLIEIKPTGAEEPQRRTELGSKGQFAHEVAAKIKEKLSETSETKVEMILKRGN